MRALAPVLLMALLLPASGPARGLPAAVAAPASPLLVITPDCGPAGPPPPSPTPSPTQETVIQSFEGPPVGPYDIRVTAAGLPESAQIAVLFDPDKTYQVFMLQADADGALDAHIRPTAVPAGTYPVLLYGPVPVEGQGPLLARAVFTVPCPPPPPSPSPSPRPPSPSPSRSPSPAPSPGPSATPTPRVPPPQVFAPALTLTPDVGPDGTVTTAHGTGFPASTRVQLTWSQGILNGTASQVMTDASGAFTEPILVFPRDYLGRRTLTAVALSGSSLVFAGATFLVTLGAAQPQSFLWRD